MNKSIIKTVGVVVVSAFLLVGCSEKPDDPENGGGGEGGGSGGGQFNPNISYTSFKDSRDNKSYKAVKIGNQVWMSENLNYDIPNVTTDVCYGNSSSNCNKYGRLYNWNDAMAACPSGWHLPKAGEWDILVDSVGGLEVAVIKLRSAANWSVEFPFGTDNYGFSALPSGMGGANGYFSGIGDLGVWWCATEVEDYNDYAYAEMRCIMVKASDDDDDGDDDDSFFMWGRGISKDYLSSVRCVRDD